MIEELTQIQNSGYDPAVIEHILEARKPACNESNRNTPFCQLSRALAALELKLDTLAAEDG